MSNLYVVPGNRGPTNPRLNRASVPLMGPIIYSPDGRVMSAAPPGLVPNIPYGMGAERMDVCPYFAQGKCSNPACHMIHPGQLSFLSSLPPSFSSLSFLPLLLPLSLFLFSPIFLLSLFSHSPQPKSFPCNALTNVLKNGPQSLTCDSTWTPPSPCVGTLSEEDVAGRNAAISIPLPAY
jgi:hypothetical protein